MKRFLAGSAFLVALRDIRLGVPVNFTGESFMDVIGFSSYSYVRWSRRQR